MRDRLDRFRLWRQARPFWGGLLTIVSGFEYALSAHLDLTPIKVELGPQGFLTWVIPLMLIMAGALIWVTPAQRVFYGVVAVAVAVYGLIGVNLGGFLAGMVLGIVGGALAASWGQVTAAEPQTSTMDPETAELPLVRDDPPAGGGSTARHAALAVLLIAALTAAALFGGRPTPAAAAPCPSTSPPSKPALPFPLPTLPTPSPSSNPIGDFLNAVGKKLGILPKTGSPTPAPPPSPPPPNPLPKKLKTNRDKALAMTSGCAPARTGTAPGQLRVNAVPSTQTTALLNQNGLAYGGVVTLTTGTGGTVRALKFTVATSTSTPFQLQVPVGRHTLDIRSSKLTISGNVVLYTTSISGKLFGLIPVTFTPDSPPPLVVPNLFFTNATVKLLYISADTLTAPALSLAYGS